MALVRLILAVSILLALVYVLVEVPIHGETVWARVRGRTRQVSEHTQKLGRELDRAIVKPMERLDPADKEELRRVLQGGAGEPR